MGIVASAVGHTGPPPRWMDDRTKDLQTLDRMAKRDPDALAELYDRYGGRVYSLALRIMRDAGEAEDVVQEVFLQAWRQASRYSASRGVVAAWLLTLARSRAIDRLRARRARPEEQDGEDATARLADSGPPIDWQYLSSEQIRLVRAALERLPFLHRAAIELAYFEGLTHVEIAARLEQPLGTVKTRIRAALAKLRESLVGTL